MRVLVPLANRNPPEEFRFDLDLPSSWSLSAQAERTGPDRLGGQPRSFSGW